MESSTIVIKVKFGETLRRFNARVFDEELDLDMVRLRGKILGLFNFAPDTEFILTYIDEDGDVVTLADENDLCDVVRQSLNPLRITVRLNTEKTARSYARSSGSSTPMRSTDQHPLQHLNTGVSEVLKSVPEPLRDAVSKLSNDLALKATSSAPGLSELVDIFSKMGNTYLNQFSESKPRQKSSSPSGASGNTLDASDMKNQQSSEVAGALSEKTHDTRSYASVVALHPDPEVVGQILESEEARVQKGTEVVASGVLAHGAVDLNAPPPPPPPPSQIAYPFSSVVTYPETSIPSVEKMKDTGKLSEPQAGVEWKSGGFGAANPDYLKHCLKDSWTTEMGGSLWGKKMSSDSGSSSECPFSGMPLANDSPVTPFHYAPRVSPFKRSYNHGDGIGSIFHSGVHCDGCGVHPITGPRFKSIVKENYDLCSICFVGMGNEADYIRMDRPLIPRQPLLFKRMHDHSHMHPPTMPWVKPFRANKQLDSRFILDVNILDGTIMAPSTSCTKIWRMRNNGTIVWPRGSQLCWIGGDRLSDTLSVEVEIPADGLPVEKELDIGVDFTAPELPGRYISYWRMASPSGQKFGQRVWVLIQVDASLREPVESSINLNLPPASTGMTGTGPEMVNVKVEPLVEGSFPENFIRVTELEDPFLDAQRPNKDQELNFPINDTLLVGDGGASSTLPTGASSVLYPTIDFSEVPSVPVPIPVHVPAPAPVPVPLPSTPLVQVSAPQDVHENKEREQSLLRELEEMGFKQVDLNKEILRMNEYDLEQSLDDLCSVAEWDPILEELCEMGFCDKETNKRLLKKNNGSIKRVVMDLINGERD